MDSGCQGTSMFLKIPNYQKNNHLRNDHPKFSMTHRVCVPISIQIFFCSPGLLGVFPREKSFTMGVQGHIGVHNCAL